MRDPTCNRCGSETAYTQINANDGYCDACALHRAKGRAAAPPLPEGEPAPYRVDQWDTAEASFYVVLGPGLDGLQASWPTDDDGRVQAELWALRLNHAATLAAAPAPGAVLSESERRGLADVRGAIQRELDRAAIAGNRGSGLYDDIPAALAILDGILSQPSPRPATLTVGEACPRWCGTYDPLDMSSAMDGDRRYATDACRAAGRCTRIAPEAAP